MKNITRFACLLVFSLLTGSYSSLFAQSGTSDEPEYFKAVELKHDSVPFDTDREYHEIYNDTIEFNKGTDFWVKRDSIRDPMRVVTNKFGKNWFVFGTVGAHTFRGDYSTTAGFWGTVSPDWSVGIGKWFTPGLALKVEFIKSRSDGYTQYLTGHYGYGPLLLNSGNTPYRKMRTSWWDLSGSVVFNFTRLFLGYEGLNSPKHKNQFMGSIGFGGVHHLGFGHGYGSDNEWSGHLELQYSRFFTREKRFSVDLKVRGIFYQTNFDLEYGALENASMKWDTNVGVDIGFTYYLGKKRANGWGTSTTALYQRDYRQRDILKIYETQGEAIPEQRMLSFYVFYPNNYSGRDDAPIVANSDVNAIDYLAGGIYTQKRFADTNQARQLSSNQSALANLRIENIPTERADRNFDIDFVPRGYEMCNEPLSLSLRPTDMAEFAENAGYMYAPIYDWPRIWQYRIDKATMDQQLLTQDNYAESTSYGLNAHSGLDLVREYLPVNENQILVSFADVYAAVNNNSGYISQFADPETVAMIKDVFTNGQIFNVHIYGCATSQDNFTGVRAYQVGIERNTALAENRAETVKRWLMEVPNIKAAKPISSCESFSGIHKVNTPSTRDIEAKTNRCVRVDIIYFTSGKPRK